MSTSAYYNFITSPKPTNQATDTMLVEPHSSIEIQRQSAISPSSFTASSSSNSSSSLYQFNSLTPTSSSSSSSSCASSSASSTASSTNSNLFPRNHRDFLRQTSVTPTQTHQHLKQHASQLFHSYTLHSLEPKPLKPFKNRSDYLEAMKEDLAEWLNRLHSDLDLTPDNFFAQLETGSIICRHANNVTQMGRNFLMEQNSRDTSFNNSQNESSKLNTNNAHNNDNNRSSRDSVDTDSLPSSNESSSHSSTNFLNNYNNQQHQQQSKYCSLSLGQNSFGPAQKLADRNINWFRIKMLPYKQDACPGTFFARDNICQFILWCRSLNILECLLFETDDLVARKNEKSFILCLLEVARIGFKVGMPTPLIIQLEQEIDREIENEAKRELEEKQNQDKNTTDNYGENNQESEATNQMNKQKRGKNELALDEMRVEVEQNESKDDEVEEVEEEEEEDTGPKPQVITNDLVSLHEKVVRLLCQCTCPTQFPMVRVGDNGKYKVGDKLIIFVRILRRHIMVRVGGGWQELSEFLRVKDPCRSRLYHHQQQNNSHHQIQTTQQQLNHQNHQHHQLHTKFAPNSALTMPKSHLNESSHHLNKGHLNNNSTTATVAANNNNNNNSNTSQLYTTRSFGGQRLISGSASMSWLSHNS